MPNAEGRQETDLALAAPLSLSELDEIFAPFADLQKVLLGVSGGADSLALMVLCDEWVKARNLPLSIHVASVDHQLRAEAARECLFVRDCAMERGIDHTTLIWEGEKSGANLQAEARAARYALLKDHARSIDCQHIALAHHQDDQAETLVMRLIRGSGVTGLGAMHPAREMDGLTLLRPFLDVEKARLVASLQERSLAWVEDPSNRSDHYLRVRVRDLLPMLAAEGCNAERLAATARRLRRADAALDAVAYELFLRHMRTEAGRALSFEIAAYCAEQEEFRLRLLRQGLAHVAGPAYPPREDRLIALDEALCSEFSAADGGKRTFGGCCFELLEGRLWIYREAGRHPARLALSIGETADWLGLYRVSICAVEGPDDGLRHGAFYLRALGQDGRTKLAAQGQIFKPKGKGGEKMPVALIEALPSIWVDDLPVYVCDWPDETSFSWIRVEIQEKCTKSVPNRPDK